MAGSLNADRLRLICRICAGVAFALLAVVACSAPARAQGPSGYPDGVRDPDSWYWCVGNSQGPSSSGVSSYDDLLCHEMSWYAYDPLDAPRGAMSSWGIVGVDAIYSVGGDNVRQGTMYVVPPDNVTMVEVMCSNVILFGGGTTTAYIAVALNSGAGVGFSVLSGGWALNTSSAAAMVGDPTNWMGGNSAFVRFYGPASTWRSNDPVDNWPSDGSRWGNYPRITVQGSLSGRATAPRYYDLYSECRVTDWGMAEGSPLWTPDDPIQPPTDPGFGPIPINPFPVIPIDLVPVERPIEFGGGTVVTGTCNVIVPGADINIPLPVPNWVAGLGFWPSWTISHTVPSVEVCVDEYSPDLWFMGIDIGAYLMGIVAVMAGGTFIHMSRRGG